MVPSERFGGRFLVMMLYVWFLASNLMGVLGGQSLEDGVWRAVFVHDLEVADFGEQIWWRAFRERAWG